MLLHPEDLADTESSVGCNHGYLSGIVALESSMETSDAFCGKDWGWYCHELGYRVSSHVIHL